LSILGYTAGAMEYDPLQAVNVAMWHHAVMPDVEVIWPRERPSPIDGLIKSQDSAIYHLCFTVPDANAAIASLEQAGMQVHTVVEPRPAILFGGRLVSFHLIGGFGLIELIHGDS
jgi:hypothetical protein